MCFEEWNDVSGKNITPIFSPELDRSSGNYSQLLLIWSYTEGQELHSQEMPQKDIWGHKGQRRKQTWGK